MAAQAQTRAFCSLSHRAPGDFAKMSNHLDEPARVDPHSHRGTDVPPPPSEQAHRKTTTLNEIFESQYQRRRTPGEEQSEAQEVRPRPREGRHIVVFMDGTNNTPEELRHTVKFDLLNPPPITNVVRLMRGVL